MFYNQNIINSIPKGIEKKHEKLFYGALVYVMPRAPKSRGGYVPNRISSREYQKKYLRLKLG